MLYIHVNIRKKVLKNFKFQKKIRKFLIFFEKVIKKIF